MNTLTSSILTAVLTTTLITAPSIASSPRTYTDPQGDAVIRRTDLGNDAPLPIGFEPIDLLGLSIEGWNPSNPNHDLYAGQNVEDDADFVRIVVTVAGLVSPSGPLGLNGFPYNPHQFGNRPITGFIEIDIDHQNESGGELMPIAASRYLANVARFGKSPSGSINERIAQSGADIDNNFYSGPRFERSGAEFTLIMCGCSAPTIISQDGNTDSIFDPGESWILQGRYFERFESFQPLSALFGGTDFGLFNPLTNLKFTHDLQSDQTTITLVYPITNAGAAAAVDHSVQPIDLSLTNDTSIEEALDDLIIGANFASGPLGTLTEEWEDQHYDDFREPSQWRATALIGTAPTTQQPDSFYIWTDTGFDEDFADFNLDQIIDSFDTDTFEDYINDNDGTPTDDDQEINNQIGIKDFGTGFHFFDINYDGIISTDDLPAPPCPGDLTGDGSTDFLDISAFLASYAQQTPLADLNNDLSWDFLDISAFLSAFTQGCP